MAVLSLFAPGSFTDRVQMIAGAFLSTFGGWTLFVTTACVVFCLAVVVLPQGRTKIGGPDAEPEFKAITWASMMFAAGMGSGLVFYGAAEPLIHWLSPPPGEGLLPETQEARTRSLAITQFHWALHGWGVYALAAIAIGLFMTKSGPILPSTPFPSFPPRVRRTIDIVGLIAVLFGVVASLGQSIILIGAGSEIVTGGSLPSGLGVQLTALLVITAGYLGSAALGLRKGIAVLSNVNAGIAALLALWIFLAGPTMAIIATIGESFTAYIAALPELSFRLRSDEAGRQWTSAWSLTYLLWWIAWTPFVGVFLARISRGRTVRSFVGAAVLLPCVVTLLWFGIFGGAALEFQAGGVDLGARDFNTAPQAAFRVLEGMPFTKLFQVVGIVLVAIFLVTSADSGAYVLAMFSEQEADPSIPSRLLWGLIIALMTAGAVLSQSGQNATRALAVAGAMPLSFVLLAQGVSAGMRLLRNRT